MADFCNQCAKRFSGGVKGDFAGLTLPEQWAEGLAAVVYCEGCGPIHVDPEGNCATADCVESVYDGPHAVPWLKEPQSHYMH